MTGRDDRLLDLLVSRATEGLRPAESAELDGLLGGQREWAADDLELVAAATQVAQLEAEGLESMPDALRLRVQAEAERMLPAVGGAVSDIESAREVRRKRRGRYELRGMGWYAAAAMLLLAIWAPWRGAADPPGPDPPPQPAERRAALIAEAPDVVTASWSGSEPGYEGVGGDVVWSDARQAGFMRLRGLPANRPEERQYQLWIVDPTRDSQPVDGGVFDVPAGVAEVIVPIDAKLPVDDPTVFAITLEQTGGVVVSEEPLLVVAPLT